MQIWNFGHLVDICLELPTYESLCCFVPTGPKASQAAQRDGFPVLSSTPVWTAGQGDLRIQEEHRIQGKDY